MPLPAVYTEDDLGAFMVTELGSLADVLDWLPASARVYEAVCDAEVMVGISDIADASSVQVLRAAARLSIWRAALGALSSTYRLSTDGQALDRQQMWDHARAMVIDAEQQAAAIGVAGAGAIAFDPVRYTQDPYGPVVTTGAEF